MIRSLYFSNGGIPDISLEPAQFTQALQQPQSFIWVDFQGESPEASKEVLQNIFHFHPLAIDDAISQTHVPKVDDWEDYLYVALHAIAYERETGDLEMIELDVFLGENYLVTHHDFPITSMDRVWEVCKRDERHRRHGPDHLLYLLLDGLTVDFMQAVEELDEEIEVVENQVFSKPDTRTVQRIFTLKRVTVHLRRSLAPMREVLNKLARDDYAQVDSKDRIYFRDVYDHFVRLHDIAESLRDLVGGVLDTYLSVVNNRMNDVMKTLTLITTLFMPISFLAGFFGMNFFQPVSASLTGWTDAPAFMASMGVFIIVPFGMYFWMRRRGWM